jgi:hypothetical protein
VPFVAGYFGLIPLIVQMASTRAQRRDRMTRPNHLRAELGFLEQLNTLQGKVGTTDEAARPQTNLIISDSPGKLLDQYNKLSEIPPSAVEGGKQLSPRQLSFFRRAFLLCHPPTTSGWILHTHFYVITIHFVLQSLLTIILPFLLGNPSEWVYGLLGVVMFAIPVGIVLLIIQRLARRNAARNAAQLEEPKA